MRCNFLVMCEYASKLERGGPVLVGVFRQIQADHFPTQLGTFQIACEVEVDPPEADRTYVLDLILSDEDGRRLYTNQIEATFNRRPDSGPSYCYFSGPVHVQSPIERPGIYRFDLSFGDESIGQVRLDVSYAG